MCMPVYTAAMNWAWLKAFRQQVFVNGFSFPNVNVDTSIFFDWIHDQDNSLVFLSILFWNSEAFTTDKFARHSQIDQW